jgi:hypothetical protein
MNTPDERFEDRLLHELRAIVAANPAPVAGTPVRPRSLRRPIAVGSAVTGLGVGVTTAAILLTGGAGAAYAVEAHADGSVTVTIKSIADAQGLQSKLNAAGVRALVTYVPEGKSCKQPRYAHPTKPAGQLQFSVIRSPSGATTFTVTKGELAPDETLVIEGSLGQSSAALGLGVAKGPVGACQLVDFEPPAGAITGGPGSGGSGGLVTGNGPGTGEESRSG